MPAAWQHVQRPPCVCALHTACAEPADRPCAVSAETGGGGPTQVWQLQQGWQPGWRLALSGG